AGMGDLRLVKAEDTARVRGELPHGLRLIVGLDGTSAFRAGVVPDFGQHSVSKRCSGLLNAVSHITAPCINGLVAANLIVGPGSRKSPFLRGIGQFCVEDFNKRSYSTQVGRDRNRPIGELYLVEPERECRSASILGRASTYYLAHDFGTAVNGFAA